MPITVQLSQGLLTAQGERDIFKRVADALLQVHGLTGNAFMTQAVIGHVQVAPAGSSYAGGQPQSLAVIEAKVPATTFPAQEIKDAFVKSVTDIVDDLKAGPHPRERTFVNVTYAVDGSWGIGGKAYTNDALGAAIAAAAQ
ncbi:MAG: 4-oxalocrotonate tautomerase [Ramlibacter sp.]